MKIVKSFILREIAGEAVLVPTGATALEFNGMVTLTDTAKTIWQNYEKTASFEEMVQLLLEEYDTDADTVRRDLAGFTTALLREGIIALTDEAAEW